MLKFLKTKTYDRLDGHMREVAKGAGIAFALKALGAVMQLGFSILLARTLGAEGAGVYYLALTICTIAWSLGAFGLLNSLLRFVAAHAAKQEWPQVHGVYRESLRLASLVSLSLSLLIFLFAPSLAGALFHKAELAQPLRWMALAIWPMTLVLLHDSALRGLKRIRDSQLVNGNIIPFVLLCGVALVGRFGILGAIGSYLAASLCALCAGLYFWRRAMPQLAGEQAGFNRSLLLRSCLPLLLVDLNLQVMSWSSTFALGIWGTKAEIGVFSVALRTANLTSFILVSVNSIVAPKFSELYSQGEMKALEKTAVKAAWMMTLFASPILLALLLAPELVMQIFGKGFVGGGPLLSIIAIGQFVNVATGSVGFLLVMTGRERLMRNNAAVAAIVTLVLNFTLVPFFGAVGAAISTACSMSLINLVSFYLVYREHGILTLPGVKWILNGIR